MSKLIDYFVICGLDYSSGLESDKYAEDNLHVSPLERSYKGKVLAHYPDNVSSNPFDESAVCMFSLPAGLKFRTQKHAVTQAPNFHSYVITREDGKRCYGFSLIFYEEVQNRDIREAMHTLQAMYITELSSGLKVQTLQKLQSQAPQSKSLPRYFKLSHNPSGAALTYYDICKDKLYVSKSIGIISQYGYVYAMRMFLENLYRCVPKHSNMASGLSLESYVFNLLYEVQLPAPGKSLLVHLPPSDPQLPLSNVIIQNSLPPYELPHHDYPLRLMFLWSGVDIIVQLFTCLLLEYQVLLRSTDPQKLMVVAEGVTSLLFPFTWPHVYVPIMPASLHHFLDAPVPYLMGFNSMNYENSGKDMLTEHCSTIDDEAKNVTKSRRKIKRSVSPVGYVKRSSWSDEERSHVLQTFRQSIESQTLPSIESLTNYISDSSILKNRNAIQLKSWISNQIQKRRKVEPNCRRRKGPVMYWTTPEKTVLQTVFAKHIKSKTLPSLAQCGEVISKYPELGQRSCQSVKAWINNQSKKTHKKY